MKLLFVLLATFSIFISLRSSSLAVSIDSSEQKNLSTKGKLSNTFAFEFTFTQGLPEDPDYQIGIEYRKLNDDWNSCRVVKISEFEEWQNKEKTIKGKVKVKECVKEHGEYEFRLVGKDFESNSIKLNFVSETTALVCPFTCLESDVCSIKNGIYGSDLSCPSKPVAAGYESILPQNFEIPQVCCQLGTTEAPEEVIAAVDTVLEALKSGVEQEAENFSGFGVLNWFNVVEIYTSGTKLKNLDDQITLYTAIRTDLESNRSLEEILNTYRSFMDSRGRINQTGKKFFDEKYGDLVRPGKLFEKYEEECRALLTTNPSSDCERLLVLDLKNSILDIRHKEETILKNSLNPLTLVLERYDKAVRSSENVDELNAEIFYQLAELLKQKANEELAINFYNVVVENYQGTSSFAASEKELKRLTSKGHKAWVMTKEFGVAILGLDNLIPINPCKGPVKAACKFAAVSKGLGAKNALGLTFTMPKLLLLDKERAAKVLVRKGIEEEKAGILAELLHKIGKGGATNEEKAEAGKIIREAFGIQVSKTKLKKEAVNLLPVAEKELLGPKANKFAAVLVESETIKNSPTLRTVAIQMVFKDIQEKSIVDVLEKGANASKEAADEVFEKYIKREWDLLANRPDILNQFETGKSVIETATSLKAAGLSETQIYSIIAQSMSAEHFTRWGKARHEDLAAIFPKPLETGLKVAEDVKSFQEEITNFIIEEKYPTRDHTAPLETFFQHFPQYRNLSLEELKKAAPPYIDFLSEGKKIYISLSGEKAFGQFLYRGEGSQVGGATPKPIVDLLDVFSKQGGIGGTQTGSKIIKRTYVSKDSHYALGYTLTRDVKTGVFLDEVRGVWVIKKSVLELEDQQAKYETTLEKAIKGVIPLRYVEKLLVTEETRQQILQRYGADNTQLFGRPLKDVVQAALNTDLDETRDLYIKTLLELNLKSYP